jgi:regulator of protease activity HflC (stomatin/prohibitin superfamily)
VILVFERDVFRRAVMALSLLVVCLLASHRHHAPPPLIVRARGGASLEPDVLVTGLVAAALGGALCSLRLVAENDAILVERLGKFDRQLGAGLHTILPFVERVSFAATLREQVLDVPPQQCITRDNAPLSADAVVFYKIVDPRLAMCVRRLMVAVAPAIAVAPAM